MGKKSKKQSAIFWLQALGQTATKEEGSGLRLIRSFNSKELKNLKNAAQAGAYVGVTIGNFDGMHLGHQSLFDSLFSSTKIEAVSKGAPPIRVCLSFYPHPRVFFKKRDLIALEEAPFLDELDGFSAKFDFLKKRGFDYFAAFRFSREFCALSPLIFIKEYLLTELGAKLIVVGHDWAFGQKREGTVDLLSEVSAKFGAKVIVVPPLIKDSIRISSGQLREALRTGDLGCYQELCGRDYALTNTVTYGRGIGARVLGFPTANLKFIRREIIKNGVYAAKVQVGIAWFKAAVNVGSGPTLGGSEKLVEAHLLDFSGELRKKKITVKFISRLRDEKKFSSVDELRAAIANDVQITREVLKTS